MAFFVVFQEVFLLREDLVAGGALVADILTQRCVGVHPLEVALEGKLETVKQDGKRLVPAAIFQDHS